MGTGYVRNDTPNNIADGNIINASDLDGEFDALQAAFDGTSGHSHDGTSGEGSPILVTGPSQDVITSALALYPANDDVVDLGTPTLKFKNLYIDGTAYLDTLSVAINATVAGTLGVTGSATFGSTLGVTGAVTAGGIVTDTVSEKTSAAGVTIDGVLIKDGFVDGRDVSADGTKLDGVEAGADVTDTTNVTAAGALMDSELTNISAVKGLNQSVSTTSSPSFVNITVSGTVDGRDVAADGTKLDGIEAGATGDQTASEILTLIKTVDGSGSGLDADTVDGLHASQFLRSDANDTMTGSLTITGYNYTRGHIVANSDGKSIALANNDGYGNGNITFNHLRGIPDSSGNAARIEVNVDSAADASMWIELGSGVTGGTAVGLTAAAKFSDTDQILYYAGATKLQTTSTGVDITGNITVSGTIDGRDVATDGTKLDTVETNADVTDTANVTAAGALMDSELTNITAVKGLDQGVATTSTPTFSGLTVDGNLILGDNNKAIFGAGSDLEIYHDGSNSYIEDVGTGSLYLRSDGLGVALNGAGNSPMITALSGGAVFLGHNGLTKLATTSTGVDITGNANVSGELTINDTGSGRINGQDKYHSIVLRGDVTGTASQTITAGNVMNFIEFGGDFRWKQITSTVNNELMRLNTTGLGIGTTSPATELDVDGSITVSGTVDGRDISTDGTKLDTIETNADVTDTANVTAAGALMDSELTNISAIKGLDQSVSTTSSPTFSSLNANGTVTADGLTVDGNFSVNDDQAMFYGTTAGSSCIVRSQGTNGYGSFYPVGSGTNASYIFMGNVTSGERARFTAGDNGQLTIDGNTLNFRRDKIAGAKTSIFVEASGNISFYDQAGTSQNFRWNASTSRLGINTTNPSTSLHVAGSGAASASIAIDNTGASGREWRLVSGETGASNDKFTIYDVDAAATRLTIDTSGYVGLGTTSPENPLHTIGTAEFGAFDAAVGGSTTDGKQFSSGTGYTLDSSRTGTATANHIRFYNGNGLTAVGSITTTGAATAYNTSSDERLKENIVDSAVNSGEILDALKVRAFDWKSSGEHQRFGFVAQEANVAVPEMVSQGETEEDMWSVDYSKVVPLLVKEIQELRKRVAELEGN